MNYKETPPPVTYIPRKTYPNGFLDWVVAVKSDKTKKPFVLWMKTQLDFPWTSPGNCCLKFVEFWKQNIHTHLPSIVADAACGSWGLVEELQRQKVGFLFSMSKKENRTKYLFSLLRYKTYNQEWKAFFNNNQDSRLISLRVAEDAEEGNRNQLLCTNLFLVAELPPPAEIPQESQTRTAEPDGTILSTSVVGEASLLPTTLFPTISEPVSSSCTSASASEIAETSTIQPLFVQEGRFTTEILMRKTVRELKNLCKDNGIHPGLFFFCFFFLFFFLRKHSALVLQTSVINVPF